MYVHKLRKIAVRRIRRTFRFLVMIFEKRETGIAGGADHRLRIEGITAALA